MFIDFDDGVTFWGMNIPNEVEKVINTASESIDESFENEDQKRAYHLVVENTISVLKQLLDEGVSRDNITFYYPHAETTEEMSVDEINKWLSELPN